MPNFEYVAKDKQGKKVQGAIEADGRASVVTKLQQLGYFPVSIQMSHGAAALHKSAPAPAKEVSKPAPSKAAPANKLAAARSAAAAKQSAAARVAASQTEPKRGAARGRLLKRNKITAPDIAGFNRQLADLISSGIPLVKSLALLNKQSSGNEALQKVITSVLDDVQDGATFADALSQHPKVFSNLYVAMVKSGEAGGMLDEVLERLADFSEQEEQLKGKVKSALAYPVVMILAGSVAVAVMFIYVIPKITGTFEQLGQALPAITQLLISISGFFQAYWWIVLAGGIMGVAGFLKYISTPDGKLLWHQTQLKLPIMGDMVAKREVARFSRTLGSLLKNGVSILAALEIVREVCDNLVVREEISNIIEDITQGAGIAEPLRNSHVFPPVAVNMIAIGEETGRLPEVLLRISESFEGQVERAMRTMTSLIEPLIIVTMGVVVGFIVIAMLLPIFSIDPTAGGR